MTRHAKTQRIIDEAYAILAAWNPMTLRQVFYRLVSGQVLENNESQYNALSNALVAARLEGTIPWEWIEDRLRQPRGVGDGWESVERYLDRYIDRLGDFYSAAVRPSQPIYVEAWVEKDTLSGIVADALTNYNIVLNVGRGYDGWSSVYEASERFREAPQISGTILYFGDLDPSGEHMFYNLQERLARLGCCPHMEKVVLTWDDIGRYDLITNRCKPSDTRAPAYIAKYGKIAKDGDGDKTAELAALPPDVLHERIVEAVEQHLDMDALGKVRKQEAENRDWLREQVEAIKRSREDAALAAQEGGQQP